MLSRQAQECIDAMRAANMVEGFRNPQLFAQIIDGSRIAQQSDKKTLEIPVSVLRDARIEISQITDTAELVTLLPKEADDSRGVSNVHVIYIHGGGYVFPAVPPHYFLSARLVRELRCGVSLPMYPLLPSTSIKEILSSCLEAYETIRNRYPDKRIALMGDSAGGALAIAISQICAERDFAQPDLLIPYSPFVDLMGVVADREGYKVDDPLLDWYGSREIARLLVEGTENAPDAFPPDPFYGPKKGLAPMLVLCGTLEELYPGIREFVRAISCSGGDVEFIVGEGLHHAYLLNQGEGIPEVEDGMQRVIERLRELGLQ